MKKGPRKGYKQTAEHIAKRSRSGKDHHAWLGGKVSEKGGRTRALRLYPEIGPCVLCASPRSERHHLNENTADNRPENIVPLCRKCHMAKDGRLERFRQLARRNQPKALKARWPS